jgi:hypothetical protein
MTREERIERAQEMLMAFGIWGLEEGDTDDILFRILSVLNTAGVVTVNWDSEASNLILDIVDDNWGGYEQWKATAFQ